MQPFRAWFQQVFLRSKIARNPLKVCMHGYLSNGYLNSLWNFNYKKAEKIKSLRPLLDQPWIMTKIATNIMKVSMHSYLPNAPINRVGLKGGENSSKCHKSWSARLSTKRASKYMIKFQFWEIHQKWNSIVHFR